MELYYQNLHDINTIVNDELYNKISIVKLKEMTLHALQDGKRLRSIIAYIISNKIQKKRNQKININKIIVFVEILHNVSLIIDDLPCMDNDTIRRGKPTIHSKYGEVSAQILSSYLLTKAFYLLGKNIDEIEKKKHFEKKILEEKIVEIYKNITKNLGITGAAAGQFIDTCPTNPFMEKKEYLSKYNSQEKLEELIYLKTTTFYEIGFIVPYLISGGEKNNLDKLKEAVRNFGLFFQLSDDFEDIEQDSKKNLECNPNFIVKFGEEETRKLFFTSVDKFKKIMIELEIYDDVFDEIINYLSNKVKIQKKNDL